MILEGQTVGSLKRWARSHLARREMKKCTALWREAQFQVKMHKMPQVRSTFGSCNVKRVHGAVAPNNEGKWRCTKSRLRSDRETLERTIAVEKVLASLRTLFLTLWGREEEARRRRYIG